MPARRWTVHLTPDAGRDFAQAVEWTRRRFGDSQATTYGQTLRLAVEALFVGPEVAGSRARNDLAPGLRTLHVARSGRRGRHILAYRAIQGHTIVVYRILHDAMDLKRHLPAPD